MSAARLKIMRTRSPYPPPPRGLPVQPRAGAPNPPRASSPSRDRRPGQVRRRPARPWPRFFRGGFLATLLLIALLAGLFLVPPAALLAGYGYFQVSGRIVPGVWVGETAVGGKRLAQAALDIHRDWNEGRQDPADGRQILADNRLQAIPVSPAQLGLSVDAPATAQLAYRVGHDQPVLAEMEQMAHAIQKGWAVAPVVQFDPEAGRLGLEALAGQMRRDPVDASLRLEKGRPVAVPAEVGYTIDVAATLETLAADPQAVLLSGYLPVSLAPVAPRIGDVSAAVAAAERLIEAPAVITGYDPIYNETLSWTVPAELLATWLVVQPGEAGPQVGLDAGRVADYLREIDASLDRGRWIDAGEHAGPLAEALSQGQPYTLSLRHKPTTYAVQPGDTLIKIGWNVGVPYWRILQANPGLDPEALYTGQELVIPAKDELLPLPVVPGKRVVISISQQRLWTYQDGALRSEHMISTGIDRSPTQPGVFQIQTHEINAYASVWDLHMPHFLGIYEAWPGFMNGIHGLPTLSNGRRLWANILGSPASYGCIILGLDAAEDLYHWAENGVIVEIQP